MKKVGTRKSTHPTTRLERHPTPTSRRLILALAITYLERTGNNGWEREGFILGFSLERGSTAAGVAFVVLGGSLRCSLEDTRNKEGSKGTGEAYHAVIADGRLVETYLETGLVVGHTAGPAGAVGGLQGDLLMMLASVRFFVCVADC